MNTTTDWFILQPLVHTKQDELSTQNSTFRKRFSWISENSLYSFCQNRCVLKFIRTSVEGKPFTMLFPISPFLHFFFPINVDSAHKIPSLTQSVSNCFCCCCYFQSIPVLTNLLAFSSGKFHWGPSSPCDFRAPENRSRLWCRSHLDRRRIK